MFSCSVSIYLPLSLSLSVLNPFALSLIPFTPQHHLPLTITSPLPSSCASQGANKPHHISETLSLLPNSPSCVPYYPFLFTTASHPFMAIIPARLLRVYYSVHIPEKKYPPMSRTWMSRNTLAVLSKSAMTNDRRVTVGILLVIQPASRSTGVHSATTLRLKVKPILQRRTISALILLKLRSLHTQRGPETGDTGSYVAGSCTPTVCDFCMCVDAMMWYRYHEATAKGCVICHDSVRRSGRFMVPITPPLREKTIENVNFHRHKQP